LHGFLDLGSGLFSPGAKAQAFAPGEYTATSLT